MHIPRNTWLYCLTNWYNVSSVLKSLIFSTFLPVRNARKRWPNAKKRSRSTSRNTPNSDKRWEIVFSAPWFLFFLLNWIKEPPRTQLRHSEIVFSSRLFVFFGYCPLVGSTGGFILYEVPKECLSCRYHRGRVSASHPAVPGSISAFLMLLWFINGAA